MTENTTTTSSRRRKILWAAAIAAAVVLLLGATVAFSLLNQADAVPEPRKTVGAAPSATATPPTPSESPAPTTPPEAATPQPQPPSGGVALPDDCLKIYTQAFLDSYGTLDLNHPGVETTVSRFEPIESIREDLPGIQCQWGGPTEGGIYTAVNSVTPEQGIDMVAAATASGFTCEAPGEDITLCRHSESFPEDPSSPTPDPVSWTISEDLYLRDGLVVTTWWAGTELSIDEATLPVYTTLWP